MTRDDDANSTNEIDITEEMIAAGATVLLNDPFVGEYISSGIAEAIAEEVMKCGLRVSHNKIYAAKN